MVLSIDTTTPASSIKMLIHKPLLQRKTSLGSLKDMAQTIVTEENNLFISLLLLLPICFLILKHYKKSLQSKNPPLPPGPFSWPILGNIFQIGKDPHITLTNFSKTYGPLFSIRLGTQLVVVGSSQAAAIEILKKHDRILSGRFVPHVAPAQNLEQNILSLGWVPECDDKWRSLRTLCRTELFANKAIESQACLRESKVMEMLKYMAKMENKVVKVKDVVFAAVFNMMSSILVSRDLINLELESVTGEMSGILRDIVEVGGARNISDYYPILGQLDLQRLRKKSMGLFERACNIWEPILRERRERKRGDASSQQDFLDALINNGSSDYQINMLIQELLGAGTESSSSTIEWTMSELVKNPECMKKVEEELTKEINQDEEVIKESHLPRLTYLEACVKETLRLHPPGALLLPHRAVDSCEVMNYTIPKNSRVLINFWAIGRDPKYWEEPLVFKPERFLNSNLDFKGNDFEYIPFGAGRRICPGMPMAAKQVPLVLASLIHFFNWSLPYGKNPTDLEMSEKYGLSLLKEQRLMLIPKAKK